MLVEVRTLYRIAGAHDQFGDAGDGGPARDADFFYPVAVAAYDGVTYIADSSNHKARTGIPPTTYM